MVPSKEEDAFTITHDLHHEFKRDVKSGLESPRKCIPSKYLYDEHGCEIFNKITRHPDYYLTGCELNILQTYKKQIAGLLGRQAFNLVELGPGEGIKTRILIDQFMQDELNFTYMPIDISRKYLNLIIQEFKIQIPRLKSSAIEGDYFKGLQWLKANSSRANLVLFLGSSIGNFHKTATQEFLLHLHDSLRPGDYVLIGFDLYKDINVLMQAYDDSDGLTRDFNLNLLHRMNRELTADFNLTKFRHHPTFNHAISAVESYLVSLEKQTVNIDALQQAFTLDEEEPIHVEFSHKYQLAQVEELAFQAGFNLIENFTDPRGYFIDSFWKVV